MTIGNGKVASEQSATQQSSPLLAAIYNGLIGNTSLNDVTPSCSTGKYAKILINIPFFGPIHALRSCLKWKLRSNSLSNKVLHFEKVLLLLQMLSILC